MDSLAELTQDFRRKKATSDRLYLEHLDARDSLAKAPNGYSKRDAITLVLRTREAWEQSRAETVQARVKLTDTADRIGSGRRAS